MVKYCGRCGQAFKDGQKFCISCGWSVEEKEILTPEKPFEMDQRPDRGHKGLMILFLFTVLTLATAVFLSTDRGDRFKENVQMQWEDIVHRE